MSLFSRKVLAQADELTTHLVEPMHLCARVGSRRWVVWDSYESNTSERILDHSAHEEETKKWHVMVIGLGKGWSTDFTIGDFLI